MDRNWFEMKAIRRRRLANATWIPIRKAETARLGQYGCERYKEEFQGAGSLMVPLKLRDQVEWLGWMNIGLIHRQSPEATETSYKPTDIYQLYTGKDPGVALVLEQVFDGGKTVWHLNQDFVFALGLLREGDSWVRPDEGYMEVARLKQNNEGKPVLMEVRTEHLRDYLAARDMALRVARYQSRTGVFSSIDHLGWKEGVHKDNDESAGIRFKNRISRIHEGGHPYGEKTHVFHVARNDIDPDDDAPVMGPESDSNIDHDSWAVQQKGRPLFLVRGDFWIDEWIEPAEHSPRVRWDKVPSSVEFIVDPSGKKMNADDLNDEKRWLWFRSDAFKALTSRRGAAVDWYTRDTGNIALSPGGGIHFGINDSHLITIYARDIAHLPEWQQRVWAGHNVTPDGKVSRESLASQVEVKFVDTKAPESSFLPAMEDLDKAVETRWGKKLFRAHDEVSQISHTINRFRSDGPKGLFGLAKDVHRLVSERIDVGVLKSIAPPKGGERLGSLKSLERVLSHITKDAEEAKRALTPLVGISELRQADAHLLESPKIKEAMKLIPIDETAHPMDQGFQLIEAAVLALENICKIIETSGQ